MLEGRRCGANGSRHKSVKAAEGGSAAFTERERERDGLTLPDRFVLHPIDFAHEPYHIRIAHRT